MIAMAVPKGLKPLGICFGDVRCNIPMYLNTIIYYFIAKNAGIEEHFTDFTLGHSWTTIAIAIRPGFTQGFLL
tara:strand:+ start:355 stop:573 length:219 start_codon:yes stop_codon:yes gene_type:complete